MQLIRKVGLVFIGGTVGTMIAGGALNAILGNPWEDPPQGISVFAGLLLGNFLYAAVLYFPIRNSLLSGKALFAAAFLACFGLSVFLTQVEALVFLDMESSQLLFASIHGTLAALIFAGLAVRVYARRSASAMERGSRLSSGQWVWRIAVADVSYVVLYFAAGLMIIGFVKEFYDTQNLQVGPWILPLQIVRGLAYVAFTIWLVRSLHGPRWQVALSMALLFPVYAGVAALLTPNGIMPDHVRYWHMLEIGWSNFVFGGIIGFLFWQRIESTEAPSVSDEPSRATLGG